MWLCRQPPFHLPASLLLSAASEVPSADLPSEMMFEGEGTPGLARADMPSRPGDFHPEPLTEPDVSLAAYPARATPRRLPPSAETNRVHPAQAVDPYISPTWVTCSLRSTGITPFPRYYEAVRPCIGASVLSASRVRRLCLFPYHRHTGSQVPIPEPRLESRLLYTGHRMASK